MVLTAADYLNQLQALLPHGPAWPREPDALLTRMLSGFAEELARVDARLAVLVNEADPRGTYELLTDWERVAGLPDSCLAGATQSTAERRSALVARLTTIGGQTPAYFVALAASLGYAVTVSEFRPYRVNSAVNDPIYGELWIFVWQVNSALDTVRRFTVQGAVDDPLASWGNAILECAISRLKPAHTKVLFAYT